MINPGKEPELIEEVDIRKDFPVTRKFIYMNNGAIAPTPLSTVKAVTDFMLRCSEQGPDSKETADYTTSLMAELRTRIGHLINCEPEEVVFVQSTTEGLNLVANGMQWKKGDAIIVRGGTHEHYANYLPWVALGEKKGVMLKELKMIDESGNFDLGDLEKLTSTDVKLITLSHGLYNTGAIMPVDKVGKIAREKGIPFCIDAAQTAGSVKIDVKQIGCDFMAFPGFKWLCGPTGIGIFYCNKKSADLLSPTITGGESAILSKDKKFAYADLPQKFQGGFRNYPGVAGLESSLRYILRLGMENVRKKNMKVAKVLREDLQKLQGVKVYGPEREEDRTSIVAFLAPKDSETIVGKLEQNSIIFAAREIGDGKKAVRAAPHFFNSEEEATTSVSYIKSVIK